MVNLKPTRIVINIPPQNTQKDDTKEVYVYGSDEDVAPRKIKRITAKKNPMKVGLDEGLRKKNTKVVE